MTKNGLSAEVISHALGLIKDGFLFEQLCHGILAARFGHGFKPIGGIHDGGADGSLQLFEDDQSKSVIFQCSIQEDLKSKIRQTATRLAKTRPSYARLVYVTSRDCADSDVIEGDLSLEVGKNVRVFDKKWLISQIIAHESCKNSYLIFVESHFHQFSRPGASTYITNLDRDPRVFVFLRQQFDEYKGKANLDILLADSLVLLALEGTNPEENIFRNKDNMIVKIRECLGSANAKIENLCVKRLDHLSAKPNRVINYHKSENGYCLPFDTRVSIKQRSIDDEAMHSAFTDFIEKATNDICPGKSAKFHNAVTKLTVDAIAALFKKQGVDFSNCISNSNMKCLEDVVSLEEILDGCTSPIAGSSADERNSLKRSALSVIRKIIYQGDAPSLEFLRRLSQTYMMLFLTQCDPAVSNHFYTLASKQKVFVCTSILIPALSEIHLPRENRRFYSLLKNATSSGIKLLITPTILQELSSHIKNTILEFENDYVGNEEYWMDRSSVGLIKKILIRSYFYARIDGYVSSFPDFLDAFVSYNSSDREGELVEWLKGELGIDIVTEDQLDVNINDEEYQQIYQRLKKVKASDHQADGDARTILTILKLREKDNAGSTSIFGYSTWWLSLDRSTMRAAQAVLGDRPSCYMRPDFLVNYIALTPHPQGVDETFTSLFPTLAGASISQHFNPRIQDSVARAVADFRGKSPARVKAIIRTMTDRLKVDPGVYVDSEFRHELQSIPDDKP